MRKDRDFVFLFRCMCVVMIPRELQCRLNLITTTAGRIPTMGTVSFAPAYSVALDDMASRFPHIFASDRMTIAHFAVGLYPYSCTTSGSWNTSAEFAELYSQTNGGLLQHAAGQTVILCGVCPPVFPIVGDFAREDDLLVLSCGPSKLSPERHPTTANILPGTNRDYGEALVALMDFLFWKSVAIIWDVVSRSQELAGKMSGYMEGLLPALEERHGRIDHLVVKMDSTTETTPWAYVSALWRAGNFSRIIMCVTLHRPLRELMATAFDLGLLVNRTDYVFIFMFIYQVPGENPPEWNQGDAIDLKVKEAFKSMLIIRAQPLNWTQLNNITERIVRRGSEQFNVTYDRNNKLNEFAIGCYETVELLAVVLDRMRANAQHLVTPAAFLPHLRDQTFPLSFRNITFGPDGARIAALVLQKFHRESGTFQDVTKFGLNSRHALGSISYRDVWTGPIPPDRPPCGFNGEHCQGNSMWQFRTTIGVSVGVVVSAVLAATVLSYWHVRQFSPEQQMWWQLDSTQLLLRLWTHWSEWSTQAHRQDTGR